MAAPGPALERVGGYQVLAKAGAGGMGVVYKAFDPKLNRPVALKFLTTEVEGADRERLLREARAASTLDHPNIATVHAAGEAEDGRLFIVMSFYDGATLAQKMRDGPLQPEKAINITIEVARGLEHAHAHGVIHRDIKPSNVIITSDGVAKIVDFGLARHFTPSGSTQSANISGTLAYMSPEQAAGKSVDARSDIWSLGVLLYQMLSGRLPFQADSAVTTALAIMNAPPGPIPEAPDALQLVIYRALAKDPAARYASCTELLDDLRKLALDDSQPTVESRELRRQVRRAWQETAPGTGRRRFRPALSVAAALVIAALFFIPSLQVPTSRSPGSGGKTSSAAYTSYLKGREYLERLDKPGNIDAAIAEFESSVKTDPNYALGFAALAEAYWDKYRMDVNPQWLTRAQSYSKRAIELNDQLPTVHVTLGRLHTLSKERELALQEFQRARQLDPNNSEALRGMAGIYDSMNRIQDAERLYREATMLRPDSWVAFSEFGSFYVRHREYDKAIGQYRVAVQLTPDNALAHSNLGVALQNLDRLDEAEQEFKKSLDLQPTYLGYANLGTLHYRQRRWADAAAMAERALRLNQTDYGIWADLATAYEWLNQQEKARKAYEEELKRLEQAVRRTPDNIDVLCELGVVYSKQHLSAKALRYADAALARAGDDPTILAGVAEAYENLGDRTRALTLLEKAMSKGLPVAEIERNARFQDLLRDVRFRRLAIAPTATTPR